MTSLEGHVEKGWGHELIFATNEKYCGKLLSFNRGAKFSMHFHHEKDETWYVRIHKAKDLITREHDVCRQILLNQIDDAKAFLPEEDQRRIAQYEHDLMNAIHSKVAQLTEYVNHLHKLDLSRKDYALKHAINNHSIVNAIVYKAWEDSSAIFNLVVDVIVRNTNKAKNFEEIKGILLENVSY